MFEVRETEQFVDWFHGLRDREARARIAMRIDHLRRGLFGDWRSVGGGVLELRVHYGPGYRVYAAIRGAELALLLGGGTKSTQQRDIELARELLAHMAGDQS